MKRSRRSSSPPAHRQSRASRGPTAGRRTIYALPPLELECMKTLWALGEATVREIRAELASSKPLAYTTVETIMDRLTRKGAVERRKVGRAHRYTPLYEKAEARRQAVAAVVEHFFEGSRQALLGHLSGAPVSEPRRRTPVPARRAAGPARAAETERESRPEAPIDTSLL